MPDTDQLPQEMEGGGSAQSQPGCVPAATTSGAEPSAAHTPGPWELSPTGNWIVGADSVIGDIVCDAPPTHFRKSCANWPANARLIAAAPDLLAALRPFAEASEHLHPALPDDGVTLDGIKVRYWRAAWAAIAKALGPSAQDTTGGQLGPGRTP
jgi:hypothetical protein